MTENREQKTDNFLLFTDHCALRLLITTVTSSSEAYREAIITKNQKRKKQPLPSTHQSLLHSL